MNAKISVFFICVEAINLHDSTFNTLTSNYKYSRSNRNNLPPPIQRQLYKKVNIIFQIFYCIFGMYIKFGTFWNKNEPHSSSIFEVIDSERRAYLIA